MYDSTVITAPLLRRMIAGIIDTALCALLYCIFAFSFRLFPFIEYPKQRWNLFDYIIDIVNQNFWSIFSAFIFFLIIFFVYGLLSDLFLGRTPGHTLTRSRLINTRGEEPTFLQLFLRNFFRTLEFFTVLAGFFVMAVLYSRRTLHDLLSNTIIVKR